MAALSSSRAASAFLTSSSETLSLRSAKTLSVWKTNWSTSLRRSASSRRFLSASALASASLTMRSISSSVRPELDLMVMVCSLPVPKSLALTLTIPFLSMSKVTSICGIPRGAGGISVNWKRPRVLLSAAIWRSPWRTCTSTAGWLSAAVEKTCDLLVGMVVLRSINLVKTPPMVSIPNDNGVTSKRTMSLTSPEITPPWIAAPIATTSSGLTDLLGSLPVSLRTASTTAGIRVEPPTKMTSSISDWDKPASLRAWRTGCLVRSTKSCVNSSNLARVKVNSKWSGPSADAVINGKLIWVVDTPDKSFLAFSAASLRRWRAILSLERSTPCSFLNSATK